MSVRKVIDSCLGLFERGFPHEVSLFMWEQTATFDKIISRDELECAFEYEFPKLRSRIRENGGCFRMIPLVSFNAPEGRFLRYLVAVSFSEFRKAWGTRRVLPRQIWLYAAADAAMRNASKDNSGNFFFYATVDGSLFILVFFEGRLCHWSEENGFGDDVGLLEIRLERFRKFLRTDPLFSRADSFEEFRLKGVFERRLFNDAAHDPFWRRIDLKKRDVAQHTGAPRGLCWLALVLCLTMSLLCRWHLQDDSYDCVGCIDPPAEELLPPKEYHEVVFEDVVDEVPYARPVFEKCELPSFHLMGVVEHKVAVVMFDSLPGESSPLKEGMRVGRFALNSIERDRIQLGCGDSTAVVEVGGEAM